MFCHDINTTVNPARGFKQNDIRVGFFIDNLVNGLYDRLRVERHFLVAHVVCYGVAKPAASNYWMFLHPTIGCTSNSWITSESRISAETDIILSTRSSSQDYLNSNVL